MRALAIRPIHKGVARETCQRTGPETAARVAAAVERREAPRPYVTGARERPASVPGVPRHGTSRGGDPPRAPPGAPFPHHRGDENERRRVVRLKAGTPANRAAKRWL